MKKTILALGLLTSLSSFAQVNTNAMSICDSIRRATSYPERVTACVQITGRSSYDAKVIPVINALVATSTIEALNSLTAAANANYDAAAVKVCDSIRINTSYPERVTECFRSTANNTYAPEVSMLASRLASTSTIESNNIMKTALNAYFMPSAVDACEGIRTVTSYPERVTQCVNTIKNKIFMNNAETYCKGIAASNSLEAINCLAKSSIDYVPAPVSYDLLISVTELRDLKRDLMKARSMMERGMTSNALISIGDALRTVDTVEARH